MRKGFAVLIAVFLLVFGAFPFSPFIEPAQAASSKPYAAVLVSMSGKGGKITMAPGEEKKISVEFQNTGTSPWKNSGKRFVSVYTYNPKYRTSVFETSAWYKNDQPALLHESSVVVGGIGHILIPLRAPKTEGTYKETFQLAAEDTAWISGGEFTLTIVVTKMLTSGSSTSSSTNPSGSTTPPQNTSGGSGFASTEGYAATVLLKSAKLIKVKGGETVSFTAGIKNAGTKTWLRRTVQLPNVTIASTGTDYRDASWIDAKTLLAKADDKLAPGALDFLSFKFHAPTSKGLHTVSFVMAADGVVVPGGQIDIPVEVTNDAPDIKDIPIKDTVKTMDFIDEPIMRVGTLIIDEETENKVEIACETAFEVRDGDGNLLAEMNPNEEVEVFYKDKKYWFNRGKGLEKTSSYIRFIPAEKNAICTVTNFDRRVTRNAANADNTFRNILEIRYNAAKDRVWLINELSMEMYLRGLAETSNISHLDFQKTLITAARTYALYHVERGTKHADEFFTVDAYADQVYKGYGQEQRTPRLTQSVEETRGVVVTYDGKTAITPYFSRSDGRTRDWSEVWYGDVAWLKSVPTPCDAGKVLWGHGVGMSASQALCMANQGTNWKDILKYFYTGVDLVQRWK